MSESKTFESLFLSENEKENLLINNIDILLVSDIHLNYEYLERLKEWTVKKKKVFDFIFCTGDFLKLNYPENEDNKVIAKSESELTSIINFLENICLNVIYLGGNHDPKSIFESSNPSLTVKSVNIHKKSLKIANDLYVYGIGGSIPAIESNYLIEDSNFAPFLDVSSKIKWQGYPYNKLMDDPNYKNSDELFEEDLKEFWQISKNEIGENNTTKNIKYILLSHIGPFYSNTTTVESEGKCVYSGSQALQKFLVSNKDIFLNIHGHTHQGVGIINFSNYCVINPGSLSLGDFALISLKRNFINEWVLGKTEFVKLI